MIEAVLYGLGNRRAIYGYEEAAKFHMNYVFGGLEWQEWTQCEEPEAPENEFVLWGLKDGVPVVALYERA